MSAKIIEYTLFEVRDSLINVDIIFVVDGTSNDISWCPRLEDIPHAVINLIHGFISPENGAMSSTVLEVKCANYYRDTSRSMCGKSIMQCNNGAWEGIVPHCGNCFSSLQKDYIDTKFEFFT